MNKQSALNLPGPGPGRPKGSVNKTTALLKDAILKAARLAGGSDDDEGLVEYLKGAAIAAPGPFLGLLGKVLPMQITAGDNGEPFSFTVIYEARKGIDYQADASN